MSTILPENQPRYVIDEDSNHAESDFKILSEEQAKVLYKLLKMAGPGLTEEERELTTQLQEKLDRETQRVRSLKKMTVKDKPLDEYLTIYNKKHKKTNNSQKTNDASDEDIENERVVTLVVGYTPEDVVKRYIECWNQQKFGAEFDCFSKDFIKCERQPYIDARQLFYQQQLKTGGLRIEFDEIISNDTTTGESEIVATKKVREGRGKPYIEKETYRLKLERGRWLIYSVSSGK